MLTAVIFGMCAGSVAPNQISRDPQTGQNRAKPGKLAVLLDPAFQLAQIRGQTLFFRVFFWFSSGILVSFWVFFEDSGAETPLGEENF